MDRKTPVAWLVPVSDTAGVRDDRGLYRAENRAPALEEEAKIARLESAGIVVRRNPECPLAYMRRSPPPVVSANLLEALLEEREEEYRAGYR